jgi:hypothetical protein
MLYVIMLLLERPPELGQSAEEGRDQGNRLGVNRTCSLLYRIFNGFHHSGDEHMKAVIVITFLPYRGVPTVTERRSPLYFNKIVTFFWPLMVDYFIYFLYDGSVSGK